ncbi:MULTISPECIES: bifunctional 2-polyprenyl-6-hydroxyphenol methylase/3-demethylubiquinol 3-O-methyltransferase UbiG [unclassified Ruegeria]|uniref:class I SAM-dependent methyltransferase n=1 Tax=unclassified Ruegeria TaxID=2625375 RepID=UPI0020C4E213|nr:MULTISPECIES: class I SAM-dependent methyltransferase [unclassified Ruegeria]
MERFGRGQKMKNFVQKPDWSTFEQKWLENYDAANYSNSLSAQVLRRTHVLTEKDHRLEDHYPTVLEMGVGTMAHFPFVKHGFDRYIAADHDPKVIEWLERKTWDDRVEIQQLSAADSPFEDNSVDRLIATHVLEHVPDPAAVLEQWVKIVRPGGVISLLLPCDPGHLWQLGRNLGARKAAENAGLPYDYYMALEHVNPIQNLKNILRFHFPDRNETWWPLRLASPNFNLIYAVNCYI